MASGLFSGGGAGYDPYRAHNAQRAREEEEARLRFENYKVSAGQDMLTVSVARAEANSNKELLLLLEDV